MIQETKNEMGRIKQEEEKHGQVRKKKQAYQKMKSINIKIMKPQ